MITIQIKKDTMKERLVFTIVFAFLFPLSTLLFSSCSLDENPRDQIAEEYAYRNPDALFRNTVATLYNYIGGSDDGEGLQGTCRGIYDLQTFGSDEAMIPIRGNDWYDGDIWQDMYRHSWTAGHSIGKKSWLYLYKVITLCNRSIEQLDAHMHLLTNHELKTYKAEVRGLRAICYWYLLDYADNDWTDGIRPDGSKMEFTIDGKTMNAWEATIYYCDILQEFGFRLADHYSDNFVVYNEYSPENIWIIAMDKDLYYNEQQNLIRSWHYRHAAAYGFSGENGSCATLNTLKVFGYETEEQDKRFDLNYWAGEVTDYDGHTVSDRSGAVLRYYPWEVETDLSGSMFEETGGARMKKYEVDKNATKDGKLMDNDIVLFRYADVLLMRAEAKFRNGMDGQADFDAVRERAGMPTRKISLQNLLDERLMELCWEGWRRQDQIRFNQYESLFEGDIWNSKVDESDGHTMVFPIPSDIIRFNPNFTQNKGY